MNRFFRQFLKDPLITGAIAPSSAGLSELITDTAQLPEKKCVVELGSGTGVFTKRILKKISPDCIFFTLEINPQFADETKKNCPAAIVYPASGKDIRKYLRKHRQRTCDCIISGLPWAAFSHKAQEELLGAVYSSLEYGGEFLTFVYIHGLLLPAGKKFRRLLKERFSSVKKTRIIWGNLPPAFVYHCKK